LKALFPPAASSFPLFRPRRWRLKRRGAVVFLPSAERIQGLLASLLKTSPPFFRAPARLSLSLQGEVDGRQTVILPLFDPLFFLPGGAFPSFLSPPSETLRRASVPAARRILLVGRVLCPPLDRAGPSFHVCDLAYERSLPSFL